MKFLFISPRFSGGIGGHAAMLSEQLTKNGHHVKKMETTHIPIKNMKNPSFALLSSLKSIVDRESYDIVHGFNIPSAYAMKYAKNHKITKNSSKLHLKLRLWSFLISNRLYLKKFL